ncbi:MAG: MFS transporter [Rickettsiaceae bacterium]|nr:MAG: MFS transporter [Rickettsiaceae bacterium]
MQNFIASLGSKKSNNLSTIVVVVLAYICMCIETEIYVPVFPQMIKYFNVAENQIQHVLNINFLGLCIAGLLTGPLSDSFGRKPVFLIGLGSFAISSIGCFFSNDFSVLLLWRLIQGISSSVPMVVGYAIVLDKYETEKSTQIVGFINSIISTFMAGAPLLGAWISQLYNWRANFIVIIVLSLVTFVGACLFIEETLLEYDKKIFSLKSIISSYIRLLSNTKFLAYSVISASTFAGVIVYVSNLSVIFINHLGMNITEYSYWQAITIITFVGFSLLSTKLVKMKGMIYTEKLGYILAIVGVIAIVVTSRLCPNNPLLICLPMACISGGGALFCSITGSKGMAIFPDIKGASSAMITTIRLMITVLGIFISEKAFDGTILPIANVIFVIAVICIAVYITTLSKIK